MTIKELKNRIKNSDFGYDERNIVYANLYKNYLYIISRRCKNKEDIEEAAMAFLLFAYHNMSYKCFEDFVKEEIQIFSFFDKPQSFTNLVQLSDN